MKRAAAKPEQFASTRAIRAKTDPGSNTAMTAMTDMEDEADIDTEVETELAAGIGRSADRSAKRSVSITLAGKEYRLRSDASEESLQRVASYVDQSMDKIRERTDTVDSLDIALLTALNLAREVLSLRERIEANGKASSALDAVSEMRLRGLIERVESQLPSAEMGRS